MKKAIFAAILALTAAPASAAVLYSEDFSSSTGTWTVNLGAAALFNSDDYFRVASSNQGSYFQARDTNAGCSTALCNLERGNALPSALPTWMSPDINIDGHSGVRVSLDYGASGRSEVGGGIDSEDDFIVRAKVDGTEVFLRDLVTANNTPAPVSGNVLPYLLDELVAGGGKSLQLFVTMNNYASDEKFRFDNVLVESVPEIDAASGLGSLAALGGILAFLRGRRRPA